MSIEAVRPAPNSPVWRRFADGRATLGAGAALLLQVSHPTVGAGVAEFSNFKQRPLGRFVNTLDYVTTTIYGSTAEAAEIGARVRAMHKTINGVDASGRRYHALEPRAYAWVHATLAYTVIEATDRYVGQVSYKERHELWAQWRALGQLVGVRDGDLPTTYAGFTFYLNEMIETDLECTATAAELIELLKLPFPAPLTGLQREIWRVARIPVAQATYLTTVDLLPPLLRKRLGVSLSRSDQLKLRALRTTLRGAGPLLGSPIKDFGPRYFASRHAETHRVGRTPPVRAVA
jgi:uncharacterized protein (DUF2236 family)